MNTPTANEQEWFEIDPNAGALQACWIHRLDCRLGVTVGLVDLGYGLLDWCMVWYGMVWYGMDWCLLKLLPWLGKLNEPLEFWIEQWIEKKYLNWEDENAWIVISMKQYVSGGVGVVTWIKPVQEIIRHCLFIVKSSNETDFVEIWPLFHKQIQKIGRPLHLMSLHFARKVGD